MKWTKRAAALLASLLLLSITVQAKGPFKAARPAEGRIRPEAPQEEQEIRKIPILPVLHPEEEENDWLAPLGEWTGSGTPEPSEPPIQEDVSSWEDALWAAAGGESAPVPRETAAEPSKTEPATPEASPVPAERPASKTELLFPAAEDWELLLVNPWNELPEDYDITLKALSNGMKVDERIYDDLNAMLAACRKAGLSPKVCSAYRTQAKQTYLYNNKIARLRNAGYSKKAAETEAVRWVARPGTSEHQLGLALDIVSSSYQGLTKKQEKTAEQKWLMEHCWEYGFILRYPNDKSEVTGIGYEPWHYRYVGQEVAMDMRDSGLCLEEYLLLREEAGTKA